MKKCFTCECLKSEEDFSKNKKKADGLNGKCKTCHREYVKQHYRENKTYYRTKVKQQKKDVLLWLAEMKLALACSACGENHPATLDFHHKVEGEKEFSICRAARKGLSRQAILAEIEKCVVLCSNCHRKLHWDKRLAGSTPAQAAIE